MVEHYFLLPSDHLTHGLSLKIGYWRKKLGIPVTSQLRRLQRSLSRSFLKGINGYEIMSTLTSALSLCLVQTKMSPLLGQARKSGFLFLGLVSFLFSKVNIAYAQATNATNLPVGSCTPDIPCSNQACCNGDSGFCGFVKIALSSRMFSS